MDKFRDDYMKLLDKEIEKSNKYLYEKYGEEKVKELFMQIDEEVSIKIKKQFEQFASIDDVLRRS
jgi:hypothetical protein